MLFLLVIHVFPFEDSSKFKLGWVNSIK
jgi:hypothetical protein